MKKAIEDIPLFAGVLAISILCGCATKTRSVDLDGMYMSDTGTLAIGSIEVMSAPVGEETAQIKYSEDTPWLSPSTKIHEIKILLSGTNSVSNASRIVKDICDAFTAVSHVSSNGVSAINR